MDQKQFLFQTMRHPLQISQVVSVFYSDLGHDFVSRGETHNFWEFVYVDRGQLHVETDTCTYPLAQGEITFHPPMEYHRHISNVSQDTSLCIVAFHCDCPVLAPLAHQSFKLGEEHRRTLSLTLSYGTDIFSSLVDAHDTLYLVKRPETSAAQEQLFTNYLECFLLVCAAELGKRAKAEHRPTDALARSRTEQLGQRAVDYLVSHLRQPLSISKMCGALGCSKTTLSTTFRAYTGSTIIPYLNQLKIEAAKNMIRSEDMTLTQIAEQLCFCNLNYFSTAFKRYTGMYPREYAKSIKIHNGVYLVNSEHDAILRHE